MMAKPPPLRPELANRLTRYIHTGTEIPKYYPGCWTTHGCYQMDKRTIIDEILAENPNNTAVIDIIVQAAKDGLYTRHETLVFALVKCLLVGGAALKESAYKAVESVCVTAEQLMLYTRYCRIHRTGHGQGWCKSVRNWYLKQQPLDLAKDATRVKSRYGRTHKLLLRKSHIKIDSSDYARDAVVKYMMFGLKKAKQMMNSKDASEPVFEYIQKVEDFRHCEDGELAAVMASEHQFGLEHVPCHLLTSQHVWDAILPQMPLEEVLSSIQRLHNMGYLTAESSTTAVLLSMLTNPDLIKKSKLTAIGVYITMVNYKMRHRPMKYAKAKIAAEKETKRRTKQVFDTETNTWKWTVPIRNMREQKIWGIDLPSNPAVLAALQKMIDQTWALTPATGARYLITMDMRHHMFKGRHFCKSYVVSKKKQKIQQNGTGDAQKDKTSTGKKKMSAACFYNKHVMPGHAAIILALQLLKREKNVMLAVFSPEGIKVMPLDQKKFISIEETEYMLRNASLGAVQLDAPIKWALRTKQNFDVFVNMIDRPSRCAELDVKLRGGRGDGGVFGPPPADPAVEDRCPVRALYAYRQAKKKPQAKLVTLSLATHRAATTDGSHEGVLDIVGVDEHVPTVMDAFVKGHFK